MDSEDLTAEQLRETFGQPISVYTDEDAVRDGTLVRSPYGRQVRVNLVTCGVFEKYAPRMGSAMRNVTPLAGLLERVAAKIEAGELEDGWAKLEDDGKELWAVPNQSGGFTLMFPEDY